MTPNRGAILGAIAFTTLLTAGSAQAQLAACPVSHCSERWVDINDACIPAGFAGKPFPVVHDNGVCTCPCSCVTGDTDVLLADGVTLPIAAIEDGAAAFTPWASSSATAIDHKLISDIQGGLVRLVELENGSRLVASPNHTFITPQLKVTSVRELAVDDFILDLEGRAVRITRNDEQGYSGTLFNLIVNKPSPNAVDHVIVTNGIQSGDWLLQSAHDVVEAEIDLRLGVIPTPTPSL